MTFNETVSILGVLRSRYPLSKVWDGEMQPMLAAWHHTLEDVSFADAEAFIWRWQKTNAYPPDPAEIRNEVRKLAREREEAQRSQELINSYRRPALGEGWMTRVKQSTRSNAEATAQVVELAEAWRRGEIGLDSVRRQCSGYERFVAMNHAREQVRDLVDALAAEDDAREGRVETNQGTFTEQDIRENGGILAIINGRRVLRWPTSGQPGRWWYGERG